MDGQVKDQLQGLCSALLHRHAAWTAPERPRRVRTRRPTFPSESRGFSLLPLIHSPTRGPKIRHAPAALAARFHRAEALKEKSCFSGKSSTWFLAMSFSGEMNRAEALGGLRRLCKQGGARVRPWAAAPPLVFLLWANTEQVLEPFMLLRSRSQPINLILHQKVAAVAGAKPTKAGATAHGFPCAKLARKAVYPATHLRFLIRGKMGSTLGLDSRPTASSCTPIMCRGQAAWEKLPASCDFSRARELYGPPHWRL